MRYMLLICADEKAEAQVPKAEMDATVVDRRARAGYARHGG